MKTVSIPMRDIPVGWAGWAGWRRRVIDALKGVEVAGDAQALLEQMVLAGKLVGHDHTPDGGGHPTRQYRRCDGCDRCGTEYRS